ncbi:hypothetical protein BC830DRAFT_1163565 [Chytriomyces sp. MP71]|nr:hypothetical protein BC830DRAFT_1163565 [Chytriomyces sp. MP71]
MSRNLVSALFALQPHLVPWLSVQDALAVYSTHPTLSEARVSVIRQRVNVVVPSDSDFDTAFTVLSGICAHVTNVSFEEVEAMGALSLLAWPCLGSLVVPVPDQDLPSLIVMNAPNLRTLTLNGEAKDLHLVSVLSLLNADTLANLSNLSVSRVSLQHIHALKSLHALSTLHITHGHLVDLDAIVSLAGLEALTDLSLFASSGIHDIVFVSEYAHRLTCLNLGNMELRNWSPVFNLHLLKHLQLSRSNIEDISLIGNLTQLESLDISSTHVNCIYALASLAPTLRSLSLAMLDLKADNDMRANPILAQLTHLHTLNLSGCSFEHSTVLEFLKPLQVLRKLNLSHTGVRNLRSLTHLTNLEILYLYGSRAVSLDALAGLPRLRAVGLSGSLFLRDVVALALCTQLRDVGLSGTKVEGGIAFLVHALPRLHNLFLVDVWIGEHDAALMLDARVERVVRRYKHQVSSTATEDPEMQEMELRYKMNVM